MSDAYYEKIARINLSTGEIKAEPLAISTSGTGKRARRR